MAQHIAGTFDGYTATRRPVRLLWSHEFSDIRDAIAAEQRLKKWTRAKKEALMAGDFELLHELSRSTATKRRMAGAVYASTHPAKGGGTRSA